MTAPPARLSLAVLLAGSVCGFGPGPAPAQVADQAADQPEGQIGSQPGQPPAPVLLPGQAAPRPDEAVAPSAGLPADPVPTAPAPLATAPAAPGSAPQQGGAPSTDPTLGSAATPATDAPRQPLSGPGQLPPQTDPNPADPNPAALNPATLNPAAPDPATPGAATPGAATPGAATPRPVEDPGLTPAAPSAPDLTASRPRPANRRALAPQPVPAAGPAGGTADAKIFSGADIEAASYPGHGDLPPGRSALTARVQTLLDRSGVSPGVTDGFKGGMSDSAIRAFERKLGLTVDGHMDPEVWAQLQVYDTGPVTQNYTITEDDAADLVAAIPTDYAEKAQMSRLGYISIAEKLAERFHMDEKFIAFLNPGVTLAPGVTITVMIPAKPLKGQVTRIIVDKASRRVAAYDAAGRLVVDYPATIGSTETPSPSGRHMVEGVALNPNYTYNPQLNFKQGENDKVLTIPPGPNGPVGLVWIDLDKPTYGIHGTPTPSQLFVNQSHGCVRLTNWDAAELAHMVKAEVTMVEFLDPGTTIADVTDPVTPAAAQRVVVQSTSTDDPLAEAIEAAISSTPNGGAAGSAPVADGAGLDSDGPDPAPGATLAGAGGADAVAATGRIPAADRPSARPAWSRPAATTTEGSASATAPPRQAVPVATTDRTLPVAPIPADPGDGGLALTTSARPVPAPDHRVLPGPGL